MRPGAAVSSRGRLRADIGQCESIGLCPTPAHPVGDVPHAQFHRPEQFLSASIPNGGVTLPLAARDSTTVVVRLRFNRVQHADTTLIMKGAILSTNDDGLMLWHEGDAMFARLSGTGGSVTINAGPGSIELNTWHTWTLWCVS